MPTKTTVLARLFPTLSTWEYDALLITTANTQ